MSRRTATHRSAPRRRHDDLVVVDLFSSFDVDFAEYRGTFVVWGSARDQVDGCGNAVSPQAGEWIGGRLRAVLHEEAPS